jgi:AhpD family alkylhydroperoxidase
MTKLLALAALAALAAPAFADTPKPPPAAAAAMKDIEKTFGFVPAFVRDLPQLMLASWWDATKALELDPHTALDGKTKELIGLAVAASIPCEYCIAFHTEAAKLDNATDEEIQEAIAMAGLTRTGSVWLNGRQVDKAQYRKDLERFVHDARHASAKK